MTQDLTHTQRDALALLKAATNISQAREKQDKSGLTIALDENLQLWTAIKTLVSRKDHPLNDKAKENLIKMADYVVAKTLKDGNNATETTLDTLENMNLQIAEGLLENQRPAA